MKKILMILNITFLFIVICGLFFLYTQVYQDNSTINEVAKNMYLSKGDVIDQNNNITEKYLELLIYNNQGIESIVLSGDITYVAIATIYENILGRRNYASIMNEEGIIKKNTNLVTININNIYHKKLEYSYPTVCQMIPFMKQKYCPLLGEQIGYRITITKGDDNDIFEIIAE